MKEIEEVMLDVLPGTADTVGILSAGRAASTCVGAAFTITAGNEPGMEHGMAAEAAKSSDAISDRQFAGCRLLIVDDNPQNVELLEAYLTPLKCRITSAADGVEALAAVQQSAPDLVLLDVMMPRMSGFEVCQRLKTDPATRDIPILMVTALNEVGDIERGAEAGTDDFLSKPFNKIELLTRVRSLLRITLLKRELDQQTGRSDVDRRTDLDEQTSPGL